MQPALRVDTLLRHQVSNLARGLGIAIPGRKLESQKGGWAARGRGRLALTAVILVPLGISTKFYAGPASIWVQSHLGGFFYVVFWCVLALLIWPRVSAPVVACLVFLGTSALELMQLWHPPLLEAVRSTFLGHALLGSHFAWSDFPYYAAGAVAGVVVARFVTSSSPAPNGVTSSSS